MGNDVKSMFWDWHVRGGDPVSAWESTKPVFCFLSSIYKTTDFKHKQEYAKIIFLVHI